MGLARTRTSDDQQRTIEMPDYVALHLVELRVVFKNSGSNHWRGPSHVAGWLRSAAHGCQMTAEGVPSTHRSTDTIRSLTSGTE